MQEYVDSVRTAVETHGLPQRNSGYYLTSYDSNHKNNRFYGGVTNISYELDREMSPLAGLQSASLYALSPAESRTMEEIYDYYNEPEVVEGFFSVDGNYGDRHIQRNLLKEDHPGQLSQNLKNLSISGANPHFSPFYHKIRHMTSLMARLGWHLTMATAGVCLITSIAGVYCLLRSNWSLNPHLRPMVVFDKTSCVRDCLLTEILYKGNPLCALGYSLQGL